MWAARLPEELVAEILSRLPVKLLLTFRCVSKSWRSLIDSSSFLKLHLSNSRNSKIYLFRYVVGAVKSAGEVECARLNLRFAEIDSLNYSSPFFFQSLTLPVSLPDHFRIVGSCDGLICYSTLSFGEVFLFNPSTREYRLLPLFSKRFKYLGVGVFGIGYDCFADEYKVVLIPLNGSEVHIYGSKSNTWRQINVSTKFSNYIETYTGKYAHGALHWIVGIQRQSSPGIKRFRIAAFDLVSEKLTVSDYNGDLFENPTYVMLEVLGGQLCLCCQHGRKEGYVDLWVMKDYGVRESWSKFVSFNRFITPLEFSNCGRRLLFRESRRLNCGCSLHWYDLDQKSLECTYTWIDPQYQICLQSLIRLEMKLP